jgi:SAM-dependent methyltransferase
MTAYDESAPASKRRQARAQRIAALRPGYHADLAGGTDRFFEPRRPDCPWCGSARLRVRLRTTDLVQHKPGRFVLDECDSCGHIFQNPRLSGHGLDFYYRDFYDGLGEELMDGIFKSSTSSYRSRAQCVAALAAAPRNWLDIGTGHGHFCETAREVFPTTRFDGLDLSEGVELAERHGRVARGLRGSLTELAPGLAGQYAVASMSHYLEHTPDPRQELAAAREVLCPGGLLLIEVPDPSSRYARLLGRWWLPWFQPQHLNLAPAPNLRRLLGELGFTVVREQRAQAHIPVDLVAACWLMVDRCAPRTEAPWSPSRRWPRSRRALRAAMILAAVPVLAVAALLDKAITPLAGRTGLSNAYRLLARRDEDDGRLTIRAGLAAHHAPQHGWMEPGERQLGDQGDGPEGPRRV